MFKRMFEKYKYNLLNLLVDYVSKNKDKITVASTEETNFLTVNVVLDRKVFASDKDYTEISGIIDSLGKITKK